MSRYDDVMEKLSSDRDVIKDAITSQGYLFDASVAAVVAVGDAPALMALMNATVREHLEAIISDIASDERMSKDEAAEFFYARLAHV